MAQQSDEQVYAALLWLRYRFHCELLKKPPKPTKVGVFGATIALLALMGLLFSALVLARSDKPIIWTSLYFFGSAGIVVAGYWTVYQWRKHRRACWSASLSRFALVEELLDKQIDFENLEDEVLDVDSDSVLLHWDPDGFIWFNRFGIVHVWDDAGVSRSSSLKTVGAILVSELGDHSFEAVASTGGISLSEFKVDMLSTSADGVVAVGETFDVQQLQEVGSMISENAANLVPGVGGVVKLWRMSTRASRNAKARREFMQSFAGWKLADLTLFDNAHFIPWSAISYTSVSGAALNKKHTVVHEYGQVRFRRLGRGRAFAKLASSWGVHYGDEQGNRDDLNRRVLLNEEPTIPPFSKPGVPRQIYYPLIAAVAAWAIGAVGSSVSDSFTTPIEFGDERSSSAHHVEKGEPDMAYAEHVDGTSIGIVEDSPPVSDEGDKPRPLRSVLDPICGSGNVEGESCRSCPTWTGWREGSASELVIVSSKTITIEGNTIMLVEVDDQNCIHHAWGGTAALFVNSDGTRRLGALDGVRGSRCVHSEKEAGWLVCAQVQAAQGSTAGTLFSMKVDLNGSLHMRPLLSWEDSSGATCSNGEPMFGSDFVDMKVTNNGLEVEVDTFAGRPPLRQRTDRCRFVSGDWGTRTSRLITLARDAGEFISSGAEGLPIDLRVRYIEAADVDIDRVLRELSNSDLAFKLQMRRLAALRYRNDTSGLVQRIEELVQKYPAHADSLLRQLVADCEGAQDFACARDAHEARLAADPDNEKPRFAAAWFYASAPDGLQNLERAKALIGSRGKQPEDPVLAVLTRAELYAQGGDIDAARSLLGLANQSRDDDRIRERLVALRSGTFAQTPRPREPMRPYKGPREWIAGVPSGDFSVDERAIALHLHATTLAGKKSWRDAAGFYAAAVEMVGNEVARVEIELGLGKLHEHAGLHRQAELIYWRTLNRQAGGDWFIESRVDDRVLNRLAWLYLTSDAPGVRDIDRGMMLAGRAAELTERQDPSVLDSLAEGHLQRGEKNTAIALLKRCVELDPTREYYTRRLADVVGSGD